jgi:hypothetical protein
VVAEIVDISLGEGTLMLETRKMVSQFDFDNLKMAQHQHISFSQCHSHENILQKFFNVQKWVFFL